MDCCTDVKAAPLDRRRGRRRRAEQTILETEDIIEIFCVAVRVEFVDCGEGACLSRVSTLRRV
jgi:hypothetical protein